MSSIFYLGSVFSVVFAFLLDGLVVSTTAGNVTVNEARFYAALTAIQQGQGAAEVWSKKEEVKKAAQKLGLEAMILVELKGLLREAHAKVDKTPVRLLDTKGELSKLLKTFKKTEAEALEMLKRTEVCNALLERKVESFVPIVTRADIEAFLKEKPEEVTEATSVAFQNKIQQKIKTQKVQASLESWVNALKDKFQYQFYGEYL